jgi:uncharacterized damage-inducible protein DinB
MSTRSQILRKERILSDPIQIRHAILAEAAKLSDEQHNQVFLGIWSMKDLLAHLIGWDLTNRHAVRSVLDGKVPDFYKHHDRNWQSYNAILVRKHKKDSCKELLAEARESQGRLLEFLKTIPPEKYNKDFGVRFRGYKVTVQRLLEAELDDEKTHLGQITRFLRT